MKYSESYYSKYRHTTSIRRYFSKKIKYYPRQLFKTLEKKSPKTVLDIGCGTGGMLSKIKSAGFGEIFYGMDIGHAENLPEFIHYSRCDAYHLPYSDKSFDFVIIRHLLEHLDNPIPAVFEAKRVLKDGGYVYIEVPSVKSLFSPFGVNFYDDPTHIRPFTKTSLKRLLEDQGFEDIRTSTKRSIFIIIGGIPYIFVGKVLGDPLVANIFAANLFGLDISVIGKRTSQNL